MSGSFLYAVRFLTRIPIPFRGQLSAAAIGGSLIYYPVVGALIGIMLAALAALLHDRLAPVLLAALLVVTWTLITGGLHLDGLADSLDAWAASHGGGGRDKALAVMKDPHIGAIGVVGLISVLLLKFAALDALLAQGGYTGIAIAPLLGRTNILALFLTTRYVRESGLGSTLAAEMPRRGVAAAAALSAVCVLLFFRSAGLLCLVCAAAVFVGLRAAMLRRIGGMTGDTLGASVEITEVMVLLTISLWDSGKF